MTKLLLLRVGMILAPRVPRAPRTTQVKRSLSRRTKTNASASVHRDRKDAAVDRGPRHPSSIYRSRTRRHRFRAKGSGIVSVNHIQSDASEELLEAMVDWSILLEVLYT